MFSRANLAKAAKPISVFRRTRRQIIRRSPSPRPSCAMRTAAMRRRGTILRAPRSNTNTTLGAANRRRSPFPSMPTAALERCPPRAARRDRILPCRVTALLMQTTPLPAGIRWRMAPVRPMMMGQPLPSRKTLHFMRSGHKSRLLPSTPTAAVAA